MKHVKSFLALVLTLMLICGMAVVPAAAAEGQLVGDAKLFLPSTGAIKVQYTLTTDGTTTVDGATYAITKVENADDSQVAADDVWKYAQIDAATGELYVSQAAKGKEIFLSASTADYTGSTSVLVSETILSYNFEDGVMPANFYHGSNTTGTFAVRTQENGNKYAHITATTGWGMASYIDLAGLDLKSTHLTFEGKYISDGVSKASGTHQLFNILWDKQVEGVTGWQGTTLTTHAYQLGLVAKASGDEISLTRTKWDLSGSTTPNPGKLYFPTASAVGNSTYTYDANTFVPVKIEVMGTDFTTTVNNGTPTTVYKGQDGYYFVGILNDSVANYNVSKIMLAAPVDDIEIYTGVKASATLFDAVKVVGDSKLFLPSSGTIKVQYGMETNAGEAITEGVTYSVIGEDVASYALMDAATGELLIDAKALNKTFTVKAATADAEATMEVTTGSFRYATDFQDGTIPSWITNGNGVSVATLENGNKYAPFKGESWGTVGGAKINFAGSGFAPQVLSVELKFRSAGVGDTSSQSYKNPMVPIQILYDEYFTGNTAWNNATPVETQVEYAIKAYATSTANTVTVQTIPYKQSGAEYSGKFYKYTYEAPATVGGYTYTGTYTQNNASGSGGSFSDDFSFTNAKVVIKGDKSYTTIGNGTTTVSNWIYSVKDDDGSDITAAGAPLSSIAFGTPIDDLEIYSGEKTAGAWTISGEDFLTAPYKSTSATSFNYSATPELPWADQNATVTWGLASNYAGTSIDANGKLTITGDTPTGNITIQAKDESGVVVGEKTLEIFRGQKNTYYWIDNKTFFQDFEKYDVGSKDLDGRMGNGDDDGSLIGESNWNDFLVGPTSNVASKGVGTVVQDESGNKYISSFGRKWWTSSADGAGLSIGVDSRRYNDTTSAQVQNANYFADDEITNLEADLMFDSAWVNKMDPTYSSASVITGDSDTFDIFYKKLAENTVGVYLGVVDGKVSETGAPLIAVMPVDTWFSLRLEQINATKLINVYINGRLVAENVYVEKMTANLSRHNWWIGACVDNIQLYAGSATAAVANTEIKVGTEVQNTDFAADIAMSSGINAVSVVLNEAAPANISADAKLIVARYSESGRLLRTTSAPVSVVNGKLYGGAALRADYADGDTAKVFLWNWGTLQPVK